MVQARRFALELGLLVLLGLLMTVLGPYGTIERRFDLRAIYWLCAIVGGGAIGIALDALIGRWLPGFWPRVLAVSAAMTPPVTILVVELNRALIPAIRPISWLEPQLEWQVFVIALLVMVLRAYAWRRLAPVIETRTLVVPPLPEAERAFRMRLSAKRRAARLIAVEAEDHYVRAHTDAGSELLTMRFAEALAELALAPGYRAHRSWWIAADAIESVRWSRGGGQAALVGGLQVPVSRSCAATLKAAGWR